MALSVYCEECKEDFLMSNFNTTTTISDNDRGDVMIKTTCNKCGRHQLKSIQKIPNIELP